MLIYSERKLKLVVFFLILITAIACYSNTFGVPLQFDDNIFIKNFSQTGRLADIEKLWNHLGHRFRIVTFLSFALNDYLDGINVFGYHLFNFLIHLGTSFRIEVERFFPLDKNK